MGSQTLRKVHFAVRASKMQTFQGAAGALPSRSVLVEGAGEGEAPAEPFWSNVSLNLSTDPNHHSRTPNLGKQHANG